jgi:hypothetical protein
MATSYEDYDAASLASAMVTAERAGIDEMLSEKSTQYSTMVMNHCKLTWKISRMLWTTMQIHHQTPLSARKRQRPVKMIISRLNPMVQQHPATTILLLNSWPRTIRRH